MQPLADPTGFQLTPTLHTHAYDAIEPVKNQFKKPFAVVVLGASKGIGYAIAQSYAKAGASTVIMVARSDSIKNKANELQSRYSTSKILGMTADVASAESMERLAIEVRDTTPGGNLNTIIANAAYYGPMTTSVLSGVPEDFSQVLNTNVLGVYHAARYLLPLIGGEMATGQSFVAISSLGAWMVKGEVAHTAACVSKLAQARLVQMISEEFHEKGLLVTAVHPGFVLTDMSSVVDPKWLANLTDDAELCGSFCVWLSKNAKDLQWLSGRFLNAKWDVEELCKMRTAIEAKDMLKAVMTVS